GSAWPICATARLLAPTRDSPHRSGRHRALDRASCVGAMSSELDPKNPRQELAGHEDDSRSNRSSVLPALSFRPRRGRKIAPHRAAQESILEAAWPRAMRRNHGAAVAVGAFDSSCFGSGSCGLPSPGPRHSWKRLVSSSPCALHHASSNLSAFLKLSGEVGRNSFISTLMTGCLPTSGSADLRIGP